MISARTLPTYARSNVAALLILISIFLLTWFPSAADAALGDLLNTWGGYYRSVSPTGVFVDGNGNTYVSDEDNCAILVFDAAGTFVRKWGSCGSGDGQMSRPRGLTLDSSGNVYVADTGNSRVQIFSNDGTFLRKFGSYGGLNGMLYYPQGVAVDQAGNVYVADKGGASLSVFSNAGEFLRKWGGSYGYTRLYEPSGVVLDSSGNVYVSDTKLKLVQVFSNAGTFLRSISLAPHAGDSRFPTPGGVAVDGSGNVYVTVGGYYVQVFDPTGALLRQWGQYAVNSAADGRMYSPIGIALDPSGNVYVADNGNRRIQMFDTAGTFQRKVECDAGNGSFNSPQGIALDAGGNVYVSDSGNNRIQVFDGNGAFIRKWGGLGALGPPWDKFSGPRGIGVDANGMVYVADSGNSMLHIFTNEGAYSNAWLGYCNSGGWCYPDAMAVDARGYMYIGFPNYDQVKIYRNAPYPLVRQWGSPGSGDGQFNHPQGIAVDANGNVYVVDNYNYRVQVFSNEGVFLRKWGSYGGGDGQFYSALGIAVDAHGTVYVTESHRVQAFSSTGTFLGKWGSYGSGAGQFIYPRSLAADARGNVYVLDTGNNRIQVFEGYKYDTVPPVTSAAVSGTAGSNGWYRSDVQVELTAIDNEGGSGVKEIHYSIDGGAEVVVAGSSASVPLISDGTYTVSYFAKDNAGNTETSHPVTVNIDKTPPSITINGIRNGEVYLLGAVPAAGYTVTDDLSGVASQDGVLLGGNGNNAGRFTYTVNATDNAGNAASTTATYSVVYSFSGFLAPVSLDKPFKLGSTIPVKFQLTNASGDFISTAIATMTLQLYSNDQPVGDPIDATSTSGADTGNTFRYDATDSQYIYNLSTKGLSAGTWKLAAALDDGTVRTKYLLLKTN